MLDRAVDICDVDAPSIFVRKRKNQKLHNILFRLLKSIICTPPI